MSSQFLLRRVTIVWYQNLTDQRVEGALAYASIQELISLQCPKSHIAQNKNNKVRQGKPCKKDSRIVNLQTSFSTQTSGKTRIKESLGRLDAIEESLLLQCLGVMFSCRNDQLPAAVERDGLRWLRDMIDTYFKRQKKIFQKRSHPSLVPSQFGGQPKTAWLQQGHWIEPHSEAQAVWADSKPASPQTGRNTRPFWKTPNEWFEWTDIEFGWMSPLGNLVWDDWDALCKSSSPFGRRDLAWTLNSVVKHQCNCLFYIISWHEYSA